MTITIGMAEYREVMDTIKRVGFAGINWLDCVYLRSVENNMLLVTVGNRYVQHFIEFYVTGAHLELGDDVIGIPFNVLSTTDRAVREAKFRDGNVGIGWDGKTGTIDAISSSSARTGYQAFEIVKPESDVLDICAPHFYVEDSTRFRIEDAKTLAHRVKRAARMFDRDANKRCEIGWTNSSTINVGLLEESQWQTVINAKVTGTQYILVEQFSPVTFNPELLSAVLDIGDRVVVSLKKDLKGCTFTAGYHTTLLMPIRNNTY